MGYLVGHIKSTRRVHMDIDYGECEYGESTPLPLYSLGRISGHTAGEYAKIRQVGEYRLWSINYNKLLNRADTRKEDLASPWRIECYSDGAVRCTVGASFEELEFVYNEDLIGSKIINKSGLEVFVKRPELFVVVPRRLYFPALQ